MLSPSGMLCGDVGERAAEPHVDTGQLRPSLAGAGGQPLLQGRFRRRGRCGHGRDRCRIGVSLTTIHPVTGEAGVTNGNSSRSTRMSPTSTDRITLTGSQRRELTRMTRAGRTEQRLVTRAADRARGRCGSSPTHRSHGGFGYARTPCASGVAAGAPHRGWRRWPMRNDPVAHRCSAPCRSPGSRRWPARHPRTAGYRCRGGRARSWPSRSSPTESASRSRRRRYAGGCPRTRSNRGSTSRGSSSPIPTSPPKPNGCSTCTPACGTGNRWAATTT